ncbi:MAG: LacI family DNA-binding transcriptional regulator [Victivallaceae bacterium]|nr:LacI family DNA-binding transcriptional regulator [Victivallaceae bacterium]
MASLKDIAVRTGLSMNTVSRAIRRSGYVSERARKLVDAAVRDLNYQPNRAAQSLRSNRSYEIAVINMVGEPSSNCDSMAMDKVFGIKEYLAPKSYEPNMHYMYSSPEYSRESEKLFNNILRQKPAGIIFLGEDAVAMKFYTQAEQAGIPAILVSYSGSSEYDSVYVDRKQGVYDGVKYLASQGRRNIVFAGQDNCRQRFQGYSKAAAEIGIPLRVVIPPAGTGGLEAVSETGRKTAAEILREYPETDAVIAYSDYLAAGIMNGFQTMGRRIPEDIAVVGFDNRELAMFCFPPLTTIAQPNRRLGSLLAEALLTKVLSENPGKIRIKVKMELIVRKSA